jgi:ferritin-like metal-binding protein YciE
MGTHHVLESTDEGGSMPTVTSPEQLFEHELKDIYYAEKTLTKVLPKLAEEASDSELSRAFTAHLRETEKHVTNLEKVFTKIGKSAQATPCPGIEGIKKEHDEFVEENTTSAKMLDAFLTGAAARTEHYEIAAYTGLVSQARALGERDAVVLLQENLKQEKEALKKVETISKRILKDASNGTSSKTRSSSTRSRSRARS